MIIAVFQSAEVSGQDDWRITRIQTRLFSTHHLPRIACFIDRTYHEDLDDLDPPFLPVVFIPAKQRAYVQA